ncbi:DNA repair protein complementing XP-C cells-like protein [Smittium culicis]|uniref:DNA repair protein complementing XP-C cells-like protein n=1 Tax=Smittium culicis TaxID=133412 RepID=A0A1R1YEY5_9FUNG|nr:DNA repair protein complementing XP-C cells-like protein [Smittium culicis]
MPSESDINSEEFIFDYEDDDDDQDFEPVITNEEIDQEKKDFEFYIEKDIEISPVTFSYNENEVVDEIEISQNIDPQISENIEIFIDFGDQKSKNKKKGITNLDREKRKVLHKSHLLSLLASCLALNSVSNSDFFKAWSMSLLNSATLNKLKRISRIKKNSTLNKNAVIIESLEKIIFEAVHSINSFFSTVRQHSKKLDLKTSTLDLYKFNASLSMLENFEEIITNAPLIFFARSSAWLNSVALSSILRLFGLDSRICFAIKPVTLKVKIEKNINNEIEIPVKKNNEHKKTSPIISWCEIIINETPFWYYIHPETGVVIKDPDLKFVYNNDEPYMYIVGIDSSGHVSDISQKYIPNFTTLSEKNRLPLESNGNSWWDQVLLLYQKSASNRTSKIDEDYINEKKLSEPIPNRLSDFLNHPRFALKDQLKSNQIISSDAKIIGYFRGKPIYSRSSVLDENQTPLKSIKAKAFTIKRKRDAEIAKSSGTELKTDLYSLQQTEVYKPEIVVNGIIPKSKYNRINIFHENMVPSGTVHVPINGLAKLCRNMNVEFAEAVTKFEFRKGTSTPVVEGILVLKDDADRVLSKYFETLEETEKIEKLKARNLALKNWKRLYHSMGIKTRLMSEYMS